MGRGTIERWQAAQLFKTLQPTVGNLSRLRTRMEQVGFVPSDPLYQRVSQAYKSLQALYIELHYLSFDGTGKPSRK
jgi:hypothetical protein